MHFLDLPLEIRLMIYTELLVLPEPVGFHILNPDAPIPTLIRDSKDGIAIP